ncbi:MAG: hypothetical protein U0790_23325 [Isosphaeraceae bacterium]
MARHEPDFLLGNHEWFRGLELKYGPDGTVFFTDWSDRGECHENDADNAHRENGRIYRLSYGSSKAARVNLEAASDQELAAASAPQERLVRPHRGRLLRRPPPARTCGPCTSSCGRPWRERHRRRGDCGHSGLEPHRRAG